MITPAPIIVESTDWREDITEPQNTVKIRDGDTVIGYFQNEGIKRNHPEYGNSIAFHFQVEGENQVKIWYVKANNFSLLGQIKRLGQPLIGMKVKIVRVGSKRSDTRYKIEKIQ